MFFLFSKLTCFFFDTSNDTSVMWYYYLHTSKLVLFWITSGFNTEVLLYCNNVPQTYNNKWKLMELSYIPLLVKSMGLGIWHTWVETLPLLFAGKFL